MRVSNNQHDMVRNNANVKGFKTIANYVRSKVLEGDLHYERKIDEIYKRVVGNGELKKSNRAKQKDLLEFVGE